MIYDLTTEIAGIKMRNPVLTASGTFGYGSEYLDLIPLKQLGAITVKGISPFPAPGNPTPRSAEVYGGMLNAIGLQNPGINKFLSSAEYMPYLRTVDTNVFVNIWGRKLEDYISVAEQLDANSEGIAALEINISCPNIKEGGISFGTDLSQAFKVVAAVRKASSLPLITKLSPNVTCIADFARSVVDAGTDIVSLINTVPAMAIDIEKKKPSIANVTAGLSGPAIKPIAIKMVYEVSQAVNVPIIGMGGISTAEDALEFIIAGADAIAVGTAMFYNPETPQNILTGLKSYMEKYNIKQISDLVGTVQV